LKSEKNVKYVFSNTANNNISDKTTCHDVYYQIFSTSVPSAYIYIMKTVAVFVDVFS